MKSLYPIFYLILQACFFFVYPQAHNINFDHIGIADGLSQSNVECIIQDSRGFMWFGTWQGLNKYDGYKMKVYKNDRNNKTSISQNYINAIVEGKNGELWIATDGGGLNRFDRNKEIFISYRHDSKKTNSLVSDLINHVIIDFFGKLWIGTDQGIDRFDPVKNTFDHFYFDLQDKNSLSDNYIKYIFEDSRHNLWIGTRKGGINLLNRKTNTFRRFQHDKNNSTSIGSDNIYAIFEDSKKRLWVGTDGAGLELLDLNKGSFTHFKNDENNANSLSGNTVLAINEDADNNLWVSTENGGICIFNYTAGIFKTYKNDEVDKSSISSNSIYDIYRDVKKNMWLANFAGGVDFANRDKITFAHFKHTMLKNSLSNNNILRMFEDSKKNIWVGTDGGGLNLFDPTSGNFTHFRHQKNNPQSICSDYVLSLCEDGKGNIIIGSWADGMTIFNPEKNTYRHLRNNPANLGSLSNNNVWNIIKDRDNNIWVGTLGGGLDMLNPDGNSFTHYPQSENESNSISSNDLISLFEDSDGDLWIGTGGKGLNRFNKKSKTFTRFIQDSTKNSIYDNYINSICEDSYKNLWIGTRAGLNKYNKAANIFTHFTMAEGLPGNSICGVLEDRQKNLWISTNKGISHYNPLTNTFKNFGVSDGLQSNEFINGSYCKSISGMMYFGGSNGFNQFFPDSIKIIPFDPPLVFTNFQIFNKDVAISTNENSSSPLKKSITETSTIALPYTNSVFSFEFATLNYTHPEKKHYAYMLEGFEKDWDEVGTTHTATYTNLDPGRYIFKVKGLNNDGKWSAEILRMEVIINPPFWLTWWFKLGIFMTVVAILILIYNIRVKTIKAQSEKLQLKVNKQTKQLLLSAQEEYRARKEAENARIEIEQVNKQLKITNKELEQFVYVASHDLQEPLRTTISFVELLQRQYLGKLDEKADKYLNFIFDASKRMKILITDLLDFSRIGSKAEIEKVDCNLVFNNVMADILALRLESGALIQSAQLPIIDGYPTEINLLFQNLMINAIKFRRLNVCPKININAYKKGDYWEFAVSDNGIGIAQEYMERIFDIFQRLHTRAEYEGSGIGLAHCKKIVELHQGKIWVQSEIGKGSIFYFTINEKNIG